MPEEYLPIKIKVVRGLNEFIYPDLNQISSSIRKELTWQKFTELYGTNIRYDTVDSVILNNNAEGYCGSVVPKAFATEAKRLFPDLITIMSEIEWEDYYNNNLAKYDPLEHVDYDVLKVHQLRMQMEKEGMIPAPSQEILEERRNSLDPDCPAPGIRKNVTKKWENFKEIKKIKIYKEV